MCRIRTEGKVHIVNPDINTSHHADAIIDSHGDVILPLCTIPTIGGNTEPLVINRDASGMRYRNLDDLVNRGGTSPAALKVLVEAGAMDSISNGDSKDDMMGRLEEAILRKQERKRSEGAIVRKKGTTVDSIVLGDLFGDFEGSSSIKMISQVDKMRSERVARKAAEEESKKKEASKSKKKASSWD